MPGFTNYEKSKDDESIEPITRRYYIENMSYTEIDQIPVTTPEPPKMAKNAQVVNDPNKVLPKEQPPEQQ
jgi:hypothetical protein